jgi:hypothetical protein
MERMSGIEPFQYPNKPHCRKHGPFGYSDHGDYKDWLRDEFDFRCVYCLRREFWGRRKAVWVVEHLIPRKERPDLATTYTNLVLACGTCNSCKTASGHMPDPCKIAYGKLVTVAADGSIKHHSREGFRLIRIAGLGDEDATEWRRKEIAITRNLKKHDPEEYRKKMSFPADLPDLAKRRVKNNSKPNGAKNCRFEQRKAGTLPSTY